MRYYSIKKPFKMLQFECQRVTSMDPSQREQMTSHLQTNNKDSSKGEGPIGNENPYEKTTTAKGSTRGLTRGDKQHWSFQNNDKQDCSKGERRIRKGKQWTLRSKDRQEKSKRV